jgi:pimeloyl-ACP methyl ester carboxylesterase
MAEAGVAEAPRRRSVQCASPKGLHRVSYAEWGDARNRDVVVCVHGLTRNGRDFDDLARALSGRFRVVCPDVAGRGDSDRLADPMLYTVPQYLADMVTLVARLDVEAVSWVGTSMGGLIGMALAAQQGTPIRRLVLNDAGPVISLASLQRIGSYIGNTLVVPTIEQAEALVRLICAPFGPHSDAQWRQLTEAWMKKDEAGWRPNYDPHIADVFRATMPDKDLELWPLYDAIRCPTMVLRGDQSDLLSSETAAQMGVRGPKAQVFHVKGVGHAPTLMQPDQIALVRDFLMQGDSA